MGDKIPYPYSKFGDHMTFILAPPIGQTSKLFELTEVACGVFVDLLS